MKRYLRDARLIFFAFRECYTNIPRQVLETISAAIQCAVDSTLDIRQDRVVSSHRSGGLCNPLVIVYH